MGLNNDQIQNEASSYDAVLLIDNHMFLSKANVEGGLYMQGKEGKHCDCEVQFAIACHKAWEETWKGSLLRIRSGMSSSSRIAEWLP
jgi:hypothetical protein